MKGVPRPVNRGKVSERNKLARNFQKVDTHFIDVLRTAGGGGTGRELATVIRLEGG